jgi:hypothetical protein
MYTQRGHEIEFNGYGTDSITARSKKKRHAIRSAYGLHLDVGHLVKPWATGSPFGRARNVGSAGPPLGPSLSREVVSDVGVRHTSAVSLIPRS